MITVALSALAACIPYLVPTWALAGIIAGCAAVRALVQSRQDIF